jgi:hypothetical protein
VEKTKVWKSPNHRIPPASLVFEFLGDSTANEDSTTLGRRRPGESGLPGLSNELKIGSYSSQHFPQARKRETGKTWHFQYTAWRLITDTDIWARFHRTGHENEDQDGIKWPFRGRSRSNYKLMVKASFRNPRIGYLGWNPSKLVLITVGEDPKWSS